MTSSVIVVVVVIIVPYRRDQFPLLLLLLLLPVLVVIVVIVVIVLGRFLRLRRIRGRILATTATNTTATALLLLPDQNARVGIANARRQVSSVDRERDVPGGGSPGNRRGERR